MEKSMLNLVSCPKCNSKVRSDRLEKHIRRIHAVSEFGYKKLSKRKYKKHINNGSRYGFYVFNRDKGVNSYMGSNYIYGETDT